LDLQLPVQSVLITSKVVALILLCGNLLSIKNDITLLDKVLFTDTSQPLTLIIPVFSQSDKRNNYSHIIMLFNVL
jgi:hypothetical protein